MTTRDAVLVMGFNRPNHLSQVLERIREARPTRLFAAIDGPRPDRAGEVERTEACRQLIRDVEWAEVTTWFREENYGCGRGVSANVSWFFEHVDRGIILEDDILPHPSFFPFCSELLDRYADDPRVFAVSGANVVPPEGQSHPDLPYRFQQTMHVWGWATWRRAWADYRLNVGGWWREVPPATFAHRMGSLSGAAYLGANLELTARGEVDTWDYQVTYAALRTGSLIATSNTALVENIGFGADATHTFAGESGLQTTGAATLPLADVPIEADRKAERWTSRHHFNATLIGTADLVRKYAQRKLLSRRTTA